jgi:hypothetical protein
VALMQNKVINLLTAIFLGVIVSLFGGFLQAAKYKLFINIPWGFVLYIGIFVFAIRFVRQSFQSRFYVAAFSLGWLFIALLMSVRLTAGDLVLTNNLTAISYLIGSVIILAALTTLPIKR